MNDPNDPPVPAGIAAVLAALSTLGEATAAAIAQAAGHPYSTTTPKLRTLEDTGLAERFRSEQGRTLWRLTTTGRAVPADQQPAPEQVPVLADHPPSATDPATAQAEGGEAVQPADPHPDPDPAAQTARRAVGTLRGAVLDVLEAHPDRGFKTSELCKAIDAAHTGTGTAKVSAGAVANAAIKLVATGKAIQTVERPATFALAPHRQ